MADGATAAPGKGTSVWTGRRGSQVRVTMGMWAEFASWVKSLCVCVTKVIFTTENLQESVSFPICNHSI